MKGDCAGSARIECVCSLGRSCGIDIEDRDVSTLPREPVADRLPDP
jgi:hypothetical protein